jgi:aminoglycoside phosphotransferase family enzyme
MELDCLIAALSDSAAYPYAVRRIEVRHTHISVVFLAGACCSLDNGIGT